MHCLETRTELFSSDQHITITSIRAQLSPAYLTASFILFYAHPDCGLGLSVTFWFPVRGTFSETLMMAVDENFSCCVSVVWTCLSTWNLVARIILVSQKSRIPFGCFADWCFEIHVPTFKKALFMIVCSTIQTSRTLPVYLMIVFHVMNSYVVSFNTQSSVVFVLINPGLQISVDISDLGG